MKVITNILKWFGFGLVGLLFLSIILPLVWPVPPLENILPLEQLKETDSKFVDLNGVKVHYKTYGEGTPYFILLHGFGASLFSWREVIQPLSAYGTVVAYDRPGCGLTERPLNGHWVGKNPYSIDGQVEMLISLMDALSIPKAIFIGNSAGGTIATAAAIQYPQRVTALVEVDAAIYENGNPFPDWLSWILYTPQAERIGPLLMRSIQKWGVDFLRSAWHDPSLITSKILQGYQKPLRMKDWDKALFELLRAPKPKPLATQLQMISIPVLIISGDDDRIVPTNLSIRLSGEIPNSHLVIIPECGHVPHEEKPQLFMSAIYDFLAGIIELNND